MSYSKQAIKYSPASLGPGLHLSQPTLLDREKQARDVFCFNGLGSLFHGQRLGPDHFITILLAPA